MSVVGLCPSQIPENKRFGHAWGCAVACTMPAAIGSDEGESPEPEAGLACPRLSEGMGKQPGSQGSNQEELCVFSQGKKHT